MKPLKFIGNSDKAYKNFPEDIQRQLGFDLFILQINQEPHDWKPMSSIGSGVCELRTKDDSGAYRVIYYTKLKDAVYVLHAFQKKTQKTAKPDLDLAKTRLKQLLNER